MERESPDCARSLVGQFEQPRAEECVARLEQFPGDSPCTSRDEYRKIHTPTLILGNHRDPIHPWVIAETLAGLIPNARLIEITPKSISVENHAADVKSGARRVPDPPLSRESHAMLKCSASLWSADLSNLGAEIRRVEPFTERFHLDVADGHYVPSLLFFPDLVNALRKHTKKPFEVHLMTTDPLAWIEPFAEAGANGVIFCFDSLSDPTKAIGQARSLGQFVGISLLVTEPVALLEPYWGQIDQLTIVGTPMGTKGTSMEPSIPTKIREARAAIERTGRDGRYPARRRDSPKYRSADPRGGRGLDRTRLAPVRRRPRDDETVARRLVECSRKEDPR